VLVLKYPEGMQEGGIHIFRVFDGKLKLIANTPAENQEQAIERLEHMGIKRSVPFDTDDGISGLWASGDEKKQERNDDVGADTLS
jgi:hypothetical protein